VSVGDAMAQKRTITGLIEEQEILHASSIWVCSNECAKEVVKELAEAVNRL
jgi:hypothetical protein